MVEPPSVDLPLPVGAAGGQAVGQVRPQVLKAEHVQLLRPGAGAQGPEVDLAGAADVALRVQLVEDVQPPDGEAGLGGGRACQVEGTRPCWSPPHRDDAITDRSLEGCPNGMRGRAEHERATHLSVDAEKVSRDRYTVDWGRPLCILSGPALCTDGDVEDIAGSIAHMQARIVPFEQRQEHSIVGPPF